MPGIGEGNNCMQSGLYPEGGRIDCGEEFVDRVALGSLLSRHAQRLTRCDGICPHLHQLVPSRIVPVRLGVGLHAEVSSFTDGHESLLERVSDGSP